MHHTLTNVQRAEPVVLQQYIDNRDGDLSVGLSSFTIAVGWFNVSAGEEMSWTENGGATQTFALEPGLYSFVDLKTVLEAAAPGVVTLAAAKYNGYISMSVSASCRVLLTDGLLTLLGMTEGLGGLWFDAGVYVGESVINFVKDEGVIYVSLEELNTAANYVNGAPSTLLTTVNVGSPRFGDILSFRYQIPEYRRLKVESISELKLTLRDSKWNLIDNNDLHATATLTIKSCKRDGY